MSVTIKQPRRLVRSIEFVMPSERYLNIRAHESRIEVDGDRITWHPQKKGGVLKFDFVIGNKRSNGGEDSRIEDTWALLKLDKLFPPAQRSCRQRCHLESDAKTGCAQGLGH